MRSFPAWASGVPRPDETGKNTHQDLWLRFSRLRCGPRRSRTRCRRSRRRGRFILRHDEHLVLIVVRQVGLFRTRRRRTAGGGRFLREGGGVLLPVLARALDEVCQGRESRRGRCKGQQVLERGGTRRERGQGKRAGGARERDRHAPDEALRLSCWTGGGSTSMSRFGLRSCIVCCWRSVIPYVRVGGDASLSQMNETKDGNLALLQPPLLNICKSWTHSSASSPSLSSRTTKHQPRRHPPSCPRRRPNPSRRRPSLGSSDSTSSRLPMLDNRMPD